jgi:hypothetical protein
MDRKVEEIVGGILATRFEHTLEPALLDPGRPVEVGASWELDPSLARRVLRERDVRVLRFSEPATATLERVGGEDGPGELAIRYRVPIAWGEPTRMPAHARSGDTEALLEGELRLDPATCAPVARSSHLRLRMHGVTASTDGLAEPVAWRVDRTQLTEQRMVPLETASSHRKEAVVAERRAR